MRKLYLFIVLLSVSACSYLPGHTALRARAVAPTPASAAAAVQADSSTLSTTATQLSNGITQLNADIQTLVTAIQNQPPPAPTESADGTVATPGTGSIIDSTGAVWTLAADATIDRNGAGAYNGWQSHQMVYKSHVVEILGLDGNWYKWNGAAFVPGTNPLQASYYVSPHGSDAAAGDINTPFASLGRCQQALRTGPIHICSIEASLTGFYDFSQCQIPLTAADNGEVWQPLPSDPANSAVLDGGKVTATPFTKAGDVNVNIQGLKLQDFTGISYF